MKKTKFSAIDVIIILFLALIVAFGFLKVKKMVNNELNAQKIHFSVLATNVDAGTKDIISIGDEVSISLKEKAYAKVIDVTETDHYEDKFSTNLGKYVSQKIDEKADILLKLECSANVSDTEILNNNVPIRVGEESYIHGKGYSLHGYIVIVDEIEN